MNQAPNIFVNSGIRSKINTGLLQEKNLKTLGYALGFLLAEEFEYSCPILIATDTRPSGIMIKNALIEGLLNFGHDIFDAGICPTPFVAKALKDYQGEDDDSDMDGDTESDESFFTLGIVITASHNPAEYNGIKILTPFGYLDLETEQELSNIFHDFLKNPNLIEESLPDEPGFLIDFDLKTWYQAEILDLFEKNNQKSSIVLDCAHGATTTIAPKIFQSLGYDVIAINNSLDGTKINAHSGCSNPQELITHVQKNNALWGFAFDGDGDRVIIVDQQGSIFDGDDILAILSQHENYVHEKNIVGTIMSNIGIENYFKQQQKKFLRTSVGERNLIEALAKYQAFLGSETCGHIIMMDHAFCSDGIFASLMFLQTIQNNPQSLQQNYLKHFQKHATIPLLEIKKSSIEIEKIVTDFKNKYQSRIIARPSNTEPIIRIMVEDQNEKNAEKILHELIEMFKN